MSSNPIDTHPAVIPTDVIRVRGARTNNLQDVDLDIPRDKLVVITGPSGSGKSSLAFDTIFAEGQRQYIESLSVYARQFFDQMQRPDVDFIDGLEPSICIDQRPGSFNPRSTVATVTEIYDYLRLLMARLGEPSCYECGQPIRQQSTEQIQDRLMSLAEGTKTMLLAPIVRGRRGEHKDVVQKIRKAGFVRARVDGEVYDIDSFPELNHRRSHNFDAVVDRVIIRPGIENRLSESLQLAVANGEGLVIACYQDGATWRDELFSTLYACPICNVSFEEVEPRTFSFNSPYGACAECDGLGSREQFDPELILADPDLSIQEGAIVPWKGATNKILEKVHTELESFLTANDIQFNSSLSSLNHAQLKKLIHGDDQGFIGVLDVLEKEFVTTTNKKRLEQLNVFRGQVICPACQGSRLRSEATSVRLAGHSIHEITQMPIGDALRFFGKLNFPASDQPIAKPIVAEIHNRLDFLDRVGVAYLTLDRSANTLSGGEMQRIRLATSIGSGLVGVCYVLDEPSIGLHQRDNQRLLDALRRLQVQGNSVLVVEHDEAIIRQADWVIDIGPQAGSEGGKIVAQGTLDDICENSDSITARYLLGDLQIEVPRERRRIAKSRAITIEGVTTNNLKDVDAMFPLGSLVCVTGVSGSGKSSLVNDTLANGLLRRLGQVAPKPGPYKSLRGVSQIDKVVRIDQAPIGRSSRSNAATYTGAFDEIRKVFAQTKEAKQRGFRASRFSFNVKAGRCDECQGHGVNKIEMKFLPDLYVMCDECQGARFNRQTLEIKYRGQSIADVLEMSTHQAVQFFENFSVIHRLLKSLDDVGLGYLPLGQASTTLSGGEAQRIKLATELARPESGMTLYLLDEPTTGLHFDNVKRLLEVLDRLVDKGNTVIVIEHNLDVIKCADWIIDLGPEGGSGGGDIVAVGTPEKVATVDSSHTGQFLRSMLSTQPLNAAISEE